MPPPPFVAAVRAAAATCSVLLLLLLLSVSRAGAVTNAAPFVALTSTANDWGDVAFGANTAGGVGPDGTVYRAGCATPLLQCFVYAIAPNGTVAYRSAVAFTTNTAYGSSFAMDHNVAGNRARAQSYHVVSNSNTFDGMSPVGSYDGWVTARAVDDMGAKQWTYRIGTPQSDWPFGVSALTSSGNTGGCLVTGQTANGGSLNGQTALGSMDAWVIRLSFDGLALWTTQMGGSMNDYGREVCADEALGAVYATGMLASYGAGASLFGGLATNPASSSTGFVVRMTLSAGALVWAALIPSPYTGMGLGVDTSTGNVFVSAVSTASTSYVVMGYANNGTLLWMTSARTSQFTSNLRVDSLVNPARVYVTGGTTTAIDGQTYRGGTDHFVTRFDPSTGAVVWTREFGSSSNENTMGALSNPTRTPQLALHPTLGGVSPYVNSETRSNGDMWNGMTGSANPLTWYFTNQLCWDMPAVPANTFCNATVSTAVVYAFCGTASGSGMCPDFTLTPCPDGQPCDQVTGPQGACAPERTGPNCTQPSACASYPCQNGGSCLLVGGTGGVTVQCTCVNGYTGTWCQTDIDECASQPCRNGGVCVDGAGSWSCNCASGYAGTFCQTNINECASQPCQNGGVCIDGTASFTCNCATGYTGVRCTTNINECSSAPCANGGTCVDGIGSFACTCGSGFAGPRCATDLNECASNPCANGGTCMDGSNGFTCTCVTGYTGPGCTTNANECASLPCQNGGTCTDGLNSFSCTCRGGWSGPTCGTNVDECASAPCQNGSTCTQYDPNVAAGYSCTCTAGWTDVRCQTDVNECASHPCQNGATCTQSAGTARFDCTCVAGYSGPQCTDTDECASFPCSNGGTCTDGLNAYLCTCRGGWSGPQCTIDVDECNSNPCANGGTCLPHDPNVGAGYTCACDAPHWIGIACETDNSTTTATDPDTGSDSKTGAFVGGVVGGVSGGLCLVLLLVALCRKRDAAAAAVIGGQRKSLTGAPGAVHASEGDPNTTAFSVVPASSPTAAAAGGSDLELQKVTVVTPRASVPAPDSPGAAAPPVHTHFSGDEDHADDHPTSPTARHERGHGHAAVLHGEGSPTGPTPL